MKQKKRVKEKKVWRCFICDKPIGVMPDDYIIKGNVYCTECGKGVN